MRKKNYKGRCEKRVLSKCIGICRIYDVLQYTYADLLEENVEVQSDAKSSMLIFSLK